MTWKTLDFENFVISSTHHLTGIFSFAAMDFLDFENQFKLLIQGVTVMESIGFHLL